MKEYYNVILVDDEDEVRGRISSKINKEIGFKIVGTAGNGYDAIDLLEANDVDVVLTDIKMPFIDGIELTKIIRRDYPMIKVVFITGYDEFNYAKEAISLNVRNYMTKPISSEEINSFLIKLKKELDDDYKQLEDILSMKERYEELLPIIGDSYLSSLIQSNYLTPPNIEKLELYGVDVVPHKNFTTCLITIDKPSKLNLIAVEQLKVKVNDVYKRVFHEADFKHSLLVADGIVVILSFEFYSSLKIDELLNELTHSTSEFLNVKLNIGVSKRFDDFAHFPNSYQEAKTANGYCTLYTYGNIVFSDELSSSDMTQSFLKISDYSNISRLIQYGKKDEIEELFESLKKRIYSENEVFVKEFIVIDLSNLIIKLSQQAKISVEQLIGYDLTRELSKFNQYNKMLDYVLEILLKIKDQDNRIQLSHSERLTNNTIDYIKQNYSNPDLTMEQVSQKMNVSISHLSMLFKRISGVTFSKYLITLRIDAAKELLDTTKLKIVDISVRVGYKDVYYFSHSFKKVTGVSPREYRKNEMV